MLLCLLQYGYVISLNYFVVDSLRSIIDELFGNDPSMFIVGKVLLLLIDVGICTFLVAAPLLLVRQI